MADAKQGRDRTGGAGQESIGGGDQPEERFQTPTGGAITHAGKGPTPRDEAGDEDEATDTSAQADGDDGDASTGGRGASTGSGAKAG